MQMLTSFDEKAMDFRHAVRDWLATAIPDEWRSFGGHMQSPEALRMRRDWDRRLYDGGYAGLTWPVEYGGRGLGVVEEAIFYEECAVAAAPEGLGRIGRGLAGPIMMAFGSEEQRARYLQPILAGDEIWCEGLSEPEAGSDLASLRTRARPEQDGYRVSGSKIWTSYAHYAQYCLLLARTSDSAPRHHNLGLFIVDMRDPGVSLSPIRQLTGEADFNQTFLDDVPVAAAEVIGDASEGWKMVQYGLRSGGQGPTNALLRYLEVRRQLARARQCATECMSSDLTELEWLQTRAEILRIHILRVIEARASGLPEAGEAGIIKLVWSELEQQVMRFGFDLGCPVHEADWRFAYFRSHSVTIAGGTSEIQRNIISTRALSLPRSW
jgi:alkylation response protein AidB-like acyl-CoA dehydrogenase